MRYTIMMMTFLFRILFIGALTAGLAGCDVLGSVLAVVFKGDPVAVITTLDAPATMRLGETVHVTVEADLRRSYLLSSVDAKVNEASRSVRVQVQVMSDPEEDLPPEGATSSATPDPRPATSRVSKTTYFTPRGIGRYRIEAQVKWAGGIDSVATRDLAVWPPQ